MIEKLMKYLEEAKRVSKEVEKFNKVINDNLDMSREKSEIINRLIELHSLKQIYHLNKINNNSKANENIDDILINREIHELEKNLQTNPKKVVACLLRKKSLQNC